MPESRLSQLEAYPAPCGYVNTLTGKIEPWIRCVFCNTHVIARHLAGPIMCDCARTRWTNGERKVTR